MNGFLIFAAGFATAAAVWAVFHFGIIQPKLEQLKKMLADKLAGG